MTTIATNLKLTAKQGQWLRAAAREHNALQSGDPMGEVYAEQVTRMPLATRDALVRRGMYARHDIHGMGGGFTYYRITERGLAWVADNAN
jgi:hypothetical protein